MPAPLNGHAFAPVLLEHLQAAATSGLPLGTLVLWGIIRMTMNGAAEPAPIYEGDLAKQFATSERTIRRWVRILEGHGQVVRRRGWPNAYLAVLPDEKPDAGVRLSGAKPDTRVRQNRTPVSAKPDARVRQKRTPVSAQHHRQLQEETESEKENNRLLSLAFGRGWSERQKAALLNTVDKARAAGVPVPFMAHALVSRKATGEPWKRIDQAVNKAKEIVQWLNLALEPKHLEDLQHLIDFGAAGNETPKTIRVDGERLVVAQIVNQCTTWPAPCEKSA